MSFEKLQLKKNISQHFGCVENDLANIFDLAKIIKNLLSFSVPIMCLETFRGQFTQFISLYSLNLSLNLLVI